MASPRSGGAVCRPCLSHGVRCWISNRGVNDPVAARAGWPRACPVGSFTPRLACRCLTKWRDGCAASTRRPLTTFWVPIRAHSAGGSGPRSRQVSAPCHPQDLRDLLTRRVLARPSRLSGWSCARRRARFCASLRPRCPPQRGCRVRTPARGLRTLTASARSSRTWLLRAGRGLRAGLLRTSVRIDT